MALGGRRLETWWQDLRYDPLTTPIQLEGTRPPDRGLLGENLAARYLREIEKMKILWRNFRAPHGGEIDIVCRSGDSLVFVEVKTRTSTAFGRPLEAVNLEKQPLIARGALEWLRQLDQPGVPFRFDVVEILLQEGAPPQIERVPHAFELPEPYYLP